MHMKKQNFIGLLVAVFLAGSAAALGAVLLVQNGIIGNMVKVPAEEYKYYERLDERYAKLDQIYEQVSKTFYKAPKEEDLETGMYKGLIAGLGDPYSAYMTKEEYQSWSDSTLGEFDGIGVTFSTNRNGDYVVINTIPETPAAKAGLKAGDLILAVNGKTYSSMETLGAAMKGKAGTKVTVTYARDNKQQEVTMKRAKIVNVTVESKIINKNIGYIAVSSFEEHTAEDFEKHLTLKNI